MKVKMCGLYRPEDIESAKKMQKIKKGEEHERTTAG